MAVKRLLPVTIKNLKNNIPFYVLYGLHHDPDATYCIRTIRESFLPFNRQSILDCLWNHAEDLSNKNMPVENIMGMLHAGWNHFEGKDVYMSFFPNEDLNIPFSLLEKYPLNDMRFLKCILLGLHHRDWYPNTIDTFNQYLPDYDIEVFVKTFAITSPLNHISSNTILALQAYDCLQEGRSVKEIICFSSVKNMLLELEAGAFNETAVTRRKVLNIMHSLNGVKNAVVVDSNILKAFQLGKLYIDKTGKLYLKCRKREYDLIEYYIRSLSETSGYEARQIMSMAWAGVRTLEGRYKIADMNKILFRLKQKSYIR